jgi:hypothetical protein
VHDNGGASGTAVLDRASHQDGNAREPGDSTTLGTGIAGGSSIGENLEPRHLVNCAQIAYNTDASVPFDDFTDLSVPASGLTPSACGDC